jgi:hypothetical protein
MVISKIKMPSNIDPNLVTKGTIVKIKTELAYGGKFEALAEVTSNGDNYFYPSRVDPHPTFKLLEPVAGHKQGHKFWGTFDDILEINMG